MQLTSKELDTLAAFAHELAQDDYNALPDGQEPDYSKAELYNVALDKLAASTLFAHLADAPQARAVWATNYYRGWRRAEAAGYDYEHPSDLDDVLTLD